MYRGLRKNTRTRFLLSRRIEFFFPPNLHMKLVIFELIHTQHKRQQRPRGLFRLAALAKSLLRAEVFLFIFSRTPPNNSRSSHTQAQAGVHSFELDLHCSTLLFDYVVYARFCEELIHVGSGVRTAQNAYTPAVSAAAHFARRRRRQLSTHLSPRQPLRLPVFFAFFSLFLHTLLILTTDDWSDRLPPNRRSDLLPHAAAKTRQKPDDDGGGGGTWELFLATINCNCAHQSESMCFDFTWLSKNSLCNQHTRVRTH